MDVKHEQIQRDVEDLHGFGYAQQLFRDMGGFSNFAVSFSIISILTGAVLLYGQGLANAGPGINGIGWPLITIFVILVAAAMAELASAIPTAGALYHWSAVLGGKGWGWFTAMWNFIGQFTITAGIALGATIFLGDLLGMKVKGPYEPQPVSIYMLFGGVLVAYGLLNHFGVRIVAWLNDFSVVWHVGVVAFIVGAILFFGDKGDVKNVWDLQTANTAGYGLWYVFLLGLLQAQWTYTGYDASAHISEETVQPRVRAPWGMFLAVAVSGICGYVMLFTVTWAMRDQAAVAASGTPFIQVFEQAFSHGFARVILTLVTIAMLFCGLSSVTSNSRLIFAFARDGGFPGHNLFRRVSPKWRTPVPAIWLAVVMGFVSGLYAKGYAIVTAISVIALYISYIFPVYLRHRARTRGAWRAEHDGPWSLGRYSRPVAMASMIWVAIISVVMCLPAAPKSAPLVTNADAAGLLFSDAFPFINGQLQVVLSMVVFQAVFTVMWYAWYSKRFEGPQRMGSESELEAIEQDIEAESVWKERVGARPDQVPHPTPADGTA